ncbi:MAG: ATP phosphoribosyltransferase regulatory subunit [Gammaproteobacteria bacterium]
MIKYKQNPWLLPDGVEELLPDQARQLEQLRRAVLDLYRSWGYDLIQPPFIEYLDALLTGSGNELDLKTFKLVDQLSGRLLGLRADMTPQAARIDAHSLKSDGPSRLCYLGAVMHTRADTATGSRCPIQLGAEIFGHAGPESDVEILQLMLETLMLTGIENVHVDLGHVGIYRALAEEAGLTDEQETFLFDALQRKALPEISQLLADIDISAEHKARVSCLAELNGDRSTLDEARQRLQGCSPAAKAALDNLSDIADLLRGCIPDLSLNFDLAELRGYQYQTGVVFAAFVAERGQEIARGGRYDDIGRYFGRARPATGFSADLATLMQLGGRKARMEKPGILAPCIADNNLHEQIRALREQGERVAYLLTDIDAAYSLSDYDRVLQKQGEKWTVGQRN